MIHYERYKVLLSLMRWNWQQPDWPKFTWNRSRLAQAEQQFLVGAGTLIGAVKHLDGEERSHITIETISTEAVTTAEIEGEILDRASVQSSIRRQFGLATDTDASAQRSRAWLR
jgi:Fic family protein